MKHKTLLGKIEPWRANGKVAASVNIVYKKLETKKETAGAKKLVEEYIQWLNQDLSFQNIYKGNGIGKKLVEIMPRKFSDTQFELSDTQKTSTNRRREKTLGSYCVSATASHYDRAMKKIKTHIKTLNQ